jgi:hypothetical protein
MDKYGIKLFEELVESLWKNKKALFAHDGDFFPVFEDFISAKVYRKLSGDSHDLIQYALEYVLMSGEKLTKPKFKKILRKHLFSLAS